MLGLLFSDVSVNPSGYWSDFGYVQNPPDLGPLLDLMGAPSGPFGGGDLGFLFSSAKDLSKQKLNSKDCQKDLNALSITAAQVQAGALAANFINGVGSSVTMSSLYATSPVPSVSQNAASQQGTVGSKLQEPGEVAVAQLGGPNIYVNPGRINPSDYWQNLGMVFHEVTHNITGLTDNDIQRALGLSENVPSVNIANRLRKDCF